MTMTKNLKQTESYTSQNDLTLHCTKAKIFTLTKENKIANGLNFHHDNNKPIINSIEINMLGIMIYNELKMNQHVSIRKKSLINQLNLRLVTLKKLVRVLDFKFSLPLANAIFHSKLLYGIEAWGLSLIKVLFLISSKVQR